MPEQVTGNKDKDPRRIEYYAKKRSIFEKKLDIRFS